MLFIWPTCWSASTRFESYCADGDVESDERTLDAALRRLQILTESSKRVSDELKAAYPRLSPMFPGVSWCMITLQSVKNVSC